MPADEPEKTQLLLSRFQAMRSDLLALCQALEDIADRLGGTPDKQQCIQISRAIGPLMGQALSFQEKELLPSLQSAAPPDQTVFKCIDRLKYEHYEDADFALEVAEALMEFGQGTSRLSQDAIGYLLRGFFVSLRRHLAFESEVVQSILDNGGEQSAVYTRAHPSQ